VTHPLRRAFARQATACAALGSPFMARLCGLLAQRLDPGGPLGERLFGWQEELGPAGASVPLRLCAGLHALVLGGHPGLTTVYPPHAAGERDLWSAVSHALETEADTLGSWLDRAPQTNEVRRAAPLIATGHWLAARYGLPMVLSELGASAGLNTIWDRYALALPGLTLGPAGAALTLRPDWSGRPPPAAAVTIAARGSVDLNPVDPADPAQRLRLLACLWPDQPDRRALTEAALAAGPPRPDRGDAIDWLESRLARPVPGHLHLIFHTIAWQYFPAAAQARGAALIAAAGARATARAPLAWLALEDDGQPPGAGLTLWLWPGALRLDLGRVDFHGRWVDWRAPAA